MSIPPEIGTCLAPGDRKQQGLDWPDLDLRFIGSPQDPDFDLAYSALEAEFGEAHEVETRDVLTARMSGVRDGKDGRHRLYYRMCVVVAKDGHLAAVRDHTIIEPLDADDPGVVVHLSHLLIDPAWRRSGLAAWLRALPAWDATQLLPEHEIDLVAEMEFPDPTCRASHIRVEAYGKAGFVRPELGPGVVFLQPDFRDPDEIDESGGPKPLALMLLLRRIGREWEGRMSANELRRIVHALYSMYGREFRDSDMEPCEEALRRFPKGDTPVQLVYPA